MYLEGHWIDRASVMAQEKESMTRIKIANK